jgi:carbonic anhydrase
MARQVSRRTVDDRAVSTAPVDLIYRYHPGAACHGLPATPAEARARLREGNRNLANFIRACAPGGRPGPPPLPVLLGPHAVGQGPVAAGFPAQEPFALVLGCADARTPAEITFCQSLNDLFNVRVAGNVLGTECAWSVRYAVGHFAPGSGSAEGNPRSLKLMVALGHLNCGAVRAAVEAHRAGLPPDMRPDGSVGSIVRRIWSPALAIAVEAFDAPSAFGPGASREEAHIDALCDLVVTLNAAWAARGLDDLIPPDPITRQGLEVVYGIFDPRDCVVRAGPRARVGANPAKAAFARPPRDLDGLRRLACRLVS